MKKLLILYLLLVFFCFLSTGCAAKIISHPEYNENILVTIENVKKLANLSEFQVSYIKSVLGNDSGKISSEAVTCLDSILNTVRTAKTGKRELTDEELGLIAGIDLFT